MTASLAETYGSKGYVVLKGVIKSGFIDALVEELESLKRSKCIYYSQSEHNWRCATKDIDEHGLLKYSVENFTKLPWRRSLREAGDRILKSESILLALRSITSERNSFCMWQNMLFDKSTGTVDHIDSWYLDTFPRGGVIGAWVALEQIDGEGGAFQVYEGSHKQFTEYDFSKKSHEEFLSHCANVKVRHERRELLLNKGDVVLWHPFLIHGSSSQRNPLRSRKSITAHYIPSNMQKITCNILESKMSFCKRIWAASNVNKISDCDGLDSHLRWSIGGLTNYWVRRSKNQARMIMRRDMLQ